MIPGKCDSNCLELVCPVSVCGQGFQTLLCIGNHDQVSLGGAVHALEPLVYAFKPDQAVLLSEPALYMNALWIPYRRDTAVMSAILQAGTEDKDTSIIFCHTDVQGAFMNDGMRSREGLSIDAFPENLPIYSGHFHKPHTMKHRSSKLR